MKKNLILAGALFISLSLPSFAHQEDMMPKKPMDMPRMEIGVDGQTIDARRHQEHIKKTKEFEERLKLTEEQKTKARQIRANGRKEMAPIMEAMKAKRKEIESLKETNAPKEEFEKVKSDMKELHKKAHELRIKNMKEFEAILTPAQQKELKKMKEEGRKKFEKAHKKSGCCCKKNSCNCKRRPDAEIPPQPKAPVKEK